MSADNLPRPAGSAHTGPNLDELAAQRKSMLQQMSVLSTQTGTERGQALSKQMEAFAALTVQIDKLDPKGSAARNAEAQALIEKIIKGLPR